MATPDETFPPPKKLVLKQAEFESVNEPASAPAPVGNDPMELLRINREREIAQGLDDVPVPPAKKSRRNREYIAMLAIGDLSMGGLIYWAGDPIAAVFLIAAILIYSAGLTWVMLFILEDY